jgi:cyclic pyranopterin phosphate synthase
MLLLIKDAFFKKYKKVFAVYCICSMLVWNIIKGEQLMLDAYAREINYLRISVTDRCNLRCRYCMPPHGIQNIGHANIMTFEEIVRLVKIAASLGIHKIRLTGGEPLVRRDIVNLIAEIAAVPKIDDIAITTNGLLFCDMAEELKRAGLTRVNFSLDSLNPRKFSYITRGGKLREVISAIMKALELGLKPVKINTVMLKGFNDNEVRVFTDLAYRLPLHVRFIEYMPIGDMPFSRQSRMISTEEIRAQIEQLYLLKAENTIQGNGPAQYFAIEGGKGTVGFISAMSNHFCDKCNRIRLTADGKIRGCLFDKKEFDVNYAIKHGASDQELLQLISEGIKSKPKRHQMNDGWGEDNERKMCQIGG